MNGETEGQTDGGSVKLKPNCQPPMLLCTTPTHVRVCGCSYRHCFTAATIMKTGPTKHDARKPPSEIRILWNISHCWQHAEATSKIQRIFWRATFPLRAKARKRACSGKGNAGPTTGPPITIDANSNCKKKRKQKQKISMC